ncbi:hypothetical protein [Pontibacter virosus]|uniref:Uncharacterized protein n=1 Tax=Pontibacter virosus TaxID=1765052 RepID=A0A2U1AW92_9BACT|nr:hypothetical protein [Pontibacter virosus]PVY40663.1 hypothetical protein C8E01_1062 [Pontibacter virosus]
MKLLLIIMFVALPYISFSQAFVIKAPSPVSSNGKVPEHVTFRVEQPISPTDRVPVHVNMPVKVTKLTIRKERKDSVPMTYTLQVGEEEQSFLGDGADHEVEFSHDIRGLVVSILDEKRAVQVKSFILKKSK